MKNTGLTAIGGALGVGYMLMEARWLEVNRVTLTVPNLPDAFKGKTIAFLADLHHGPYVPLSYVRHAVDMTNDLNPDFIVLGGDYPFHGIRFIQPCIHELGRLRAPLGVFGILGNHDHYDNGQTYASAALREEGIRELTNCGHWIRTEGERLWLCGVDDYWRGTQDLPAALHGTTQEDAVILLSHNPDYVEEIRDPRVGLVLAGHTHGGQVELPLIGAPVGAVALWTEISPRAGPGAGDAGLCHPGNWDNRTAGAIVLQAGDCADRAGVRSISEPAPTLVVCPESLRHL